jgi:hypothetical protein
MANRALLGVVARVADALFFCVYECECLSGDPFTIRGLRPLGLLVLHGQSF